MYKTLYILPINTVVSDQYAHCTLVVSLRFLLTEPCIRLCSPSNALHATPISFFSIWSPELVLDTEKTFSVDYKATELLWNKRRKLEWEKKAEWSKKWQSKGLVKCFEGKQMKQETVAEGMEWGQGGSGLEKLMSLWPTIGVPSRDID